MTAAFELANDELRAAVKSRMENTPADDPKMVGEQRLLGDSLLADYVHPTSQAYFDLLDRMKALHSSKSRDYGSEHDPLANIRNGALFVGIEPWKGAMVRLSDKVTRLATFNRTGRLEHEGVEDNLMDLASYALLALLLYREEHSGSAD
jgi:hypothetical protein